MTEMNFEADLINVVKHYFSKEGISYENGGVASDFATRYCEMQIRRIPATPRRVHFSEELNNSLGKLTSRVGTEAENKNALEAWRAVFYIRHLLASGGNVTPYLSECVYHATSKDGLLWDYGMHHFHLSEHRIDKAALVKRSDYLLFAIVADEDAYFVDLRRHQDPEKLLWVRQDVLRIVNFNWPNLIDSRVLRGVKGDLLTDNEKKELRRKNTNHVATFDGKAVAPLGGGMMANGSSILCKFWADRLLHEIKWHESFLLDHPTDVKVALQAVGVETSDKPEFQLVSADTLELSTELVKKLQSDDCMSKNLYRMGFVIVETRSCFPVAVSLNPTPTPPSPSTSPSGKTFLGLP